MNPAELDGESQGSRDLVRAWSICLNKGADHECIDVRLRLASAFLDAYGERRIRRHSTLAVSGLRILSSETEKQIRGWMSGIVVGCPGSIYAPSTEPLIGRAGHHGHVRARRPGCPVTSAGEALQASGPGTRGRPRTAGRQHYGTARMDPQHRARARVVPQDALPVPLRIPGWKNRRNMCKSPSCTRIRDDESLAFRTTSASLGMLNFSIDIRFSSILKAISTRNRRYNRLIAYSGTIQASGFHRPCHRSRGPASAAGIPCIRCRP